MPNALLVYPEYPPSYWGVNFALEIFGIKAAFPPLGLLTVAAMFPSKYDLRVVDMNVTPVEERDLEWADLVFTSTMIVQRESLQSVIERCTRAGVPVVAGGPYPTTYHEEIAGVDHFILDEVEETFDDFLRDLENGAAKAIYREPRKPDVTRTTRSHASTSSTCTHTTQCPYSSRGDAPSTVSSVTSPSSMAACPAPRRPIRCWTSLTCCIGWAGGAMFFWSTTTSSATSKRR